MTSFSPLVDGSWIGLGTFPFASPFGEVAEDETMTVLQHYFRDGGRYLDTAPTYAHGHIEQLVSTVIAELPRSEFFINSSCGWVRRGDGYVLSGRKDDVLDDLAGSLERLGLEHVDSYISHMPDPETPFAETMSALMEVKAGGRARFIGVSNVTVDQLRAYCEHGDVDLVQNRFSLINRSYDQELLDFCYERGIALVAYQVIERGLLTDRDDRTLQPAARDLRSRKPEFADVPRTVIRQWVAERLRPIGQRLSVSTEALATKWAAEQPGVAVVQVGASNHGQLATASAARSLELDSTILSEIEDAYADLVRRTRAAGFGGVRDMMGLETDPFQGISLSGR